jgi:predicted DNA-binding transcriptional regulator AlpA
MDTTVLDTLGAAERTKLSVSMLEKLRVYGGGPPYLKIGRSVRYRVADLDTWLAARLVQNTSERAVA